MRFSVARPALALILAAAAALAPRAPQAQTPLEVDVELVLAVDISRSMDIEELRIQRDGYVAALRDPEVIRAIEGGLLGRIAVKYFEWAGPGRRGVVSAWTLLDGPGAANAFADGLAAGPISAAVGTSISGAIDYALDAFEGNGFEGLRRVVDISGDGPNNAGRPVTAARDEAVAAGVVINGLPLMIKANDGPFSLRELDIYYEDCVIGGPLSFVLPLWEQGKFPETIRRKLILEIAAPRLAPPPSIATPARLAPIPAQLGLGGQARAPRIDCLIGEKRRQRWMEGGGWEW
ncbi:DUF1194 domain-containing protein [uncultured Albimonas sp.]|uniref:DUF1194 domain-containing protein n=1 Tax=uncultured Albimonas sp. TaxID=1331701 RepID=UPI0030EC29D0|tara:strand:- start:2138 stop:3010 length:873 start_codon:yes stop_codon:yes gene_type:complete